MVEVDIGTRPAFINPITQVTILDCCVYLDLLVLLMIVLMKRNEVILRVMVQDMEIGIKRSATLFFQNVVERFYVDGRSGYISQTIPSTSHHDGVLGISLMFYSYGIERSGQRSQTSRISSYNHGGLEIFHTRFPQEYITRGLQG